MPGTGHSHRYKGSISNRNTKSSFQVLAPWNSVKNGEKNQVAVSTGGNKLNFELMGAKMMSNYHKDGDNFILDCSLTVLGNKIVDGNVEIDGTLDVKEKATFEDDVDICGNLNAFTGTFNGILTNLEDTSGTGLGGIVTEYLTVNKKAFIDIGDINHIIDVCDNVLTLGNHHDVAYAPEVRGIAAKYSNLYNDASSVAFFGMDPSFNGGLVDDHYGQFVFLTDVSHNVGDIPAASIEGTLGRAAFGTLDISGSDRYGGGGSAAQGTGLPTQNVSGQANCQMHLVGKTIIACQTLAGGTCSSAQLDISGGINVDGDICGNGMNFAINYANVDISGGTSVKLTDGSGDYIYVEDGEVAIFTGIGGCIDIGNTGGTVDISGGTTTLDASIALNIGPVGTTIAIGNSSATVDISGLTVDISGGTTNIDATTALNIGPVSQDIIIGNSAFGTTVELLGDAVHISGETATLDATTALKIGPVATTIAIGNSNATVDISGSTVDISGGTHVNLTDGSGANINIASGLIHLDVSSTILGETLGQIKLTDGSGAYIDMSGGKIDISGDHVTLTGSGSSSLNLKGARINIGTAGSIIDMSGTVQIETGRIVIKDISATNIDVSQNLTVQGTSTLGETAAEMITVTVGAISTISAAGHITASLGDITATGGNIDVTAGDITVSLGDITATAGTVTGGSLTDGTAILTGGALSGATTVTASGAITCDSLTDGTATLASGALSGATTVTASGAVTGGSLTDGTAILTGGALSGATTVTASGAITCDSLTDGTATLASGALSGATTVTASGAVTGGSLTDGTAILTGGALSGATTINATDNITGESLSTGVLIPIPGEILGTTLNAVNSIFCTAGTINGAALVITAAASAGSLTVTSTDLVVTAGDIGVTAGDITVTGGAISTISAAGHITASLGNITATAGQVEGLSLTDGTATLTGGALSGATTVTASGAVTGDSLTDGTATLASGALSGATTVTASGAVTGGSLTDGTATLTSGALSGATDITATGTIVADDISCNGIAIGTQGITLDGSGSISAGPDDFGSVTYNGLCGRLDISGALTSGTSGEIHFTNNQIHPSSLIFVSLIPNDFLGLMAYIIPSNQLEGLAGITVTNPSWTAAPYTTTANPERIQFMIINPST